MKSNDLFGVEAGAKLARTDGQSRASLHALLGDAPARHGEDGVKSVADTKKRVMGRHAARQMEVLCKKDEAKPCFGETDARPSASSSTMSPGEDLLSHDHLATRPRAQAPTATRGR